ncbi:hypothetical protein PFISCL1PPCAC_3474, partial [Pristionchus fissidentatus]
MKCDNYDDTNNVFYTNHEHVWYLSYNGVQLVSMVICEEEEERDTPCGDFDVVDSGNSSETCYSVRSEVATWSQAAANCSERGAVLSVIHSQEANDFVMKTAVSNGLMDGLHIGLSKE